ncbi:hypothetical protein RHECNPAF_1360044 [Rhizobium etli CNPAF512]|nr:hypothetical protein RHECNPAF_1360044 [Rhizobium etli CNPAF512]
MLSAARKKCPKPDFPCHFASSPFAANGSVVSGPRSVLAVRTLEYVLHRFYRETSFPN